MYLPFELRTAPFLFDQFAKAIEWTVLAVLFWLIIIHYLDDLLSNFPPHNDPSHHSGQFDSLCYKLGVSVNKEKKDIAGTTADFMGFELDTFKMEARLPNEKLLRGKAIT